MEYFFFITKFLNIKNIPMECSLIILWKYYEKEKLGYDRNTINIIMEYTLNIN